MEDIQNGSCNSCLCKRACYIIGCLRDHDLLKDQIENVVNCNGSIKRILALLTATKPPKVSAKKIYEHNAKSKSAKQVKQKKTNFKKASTRIQKTGSKNHRKPKEKIHRERDRDRIFLKEITRDYNYKK